MYNIVIIQISLMGTVVGGGTLGGGCRGDEEVMKTSVKQ